MIHCYTIVDETGEVIRTIETDNLGIVELNTPQGGRAITGTASFFDYWDEAAGMFFPRPAQPSPSHAWNAATKTWIDPRTLDDLRAEAWARIKTARAAAESAPLTVGTHTFDVDPASQQRIAGAVQMAQLALGAGQAYGWSITWTLADNTTASLSATEMVDVGLSLAAQINAAHQRSRVLRTQIDAAQSAAELDAITWSPT